MARIKASELSVSDLQRHPVWKWSDELEQSEDSVVPVELTEDALADADSLMIYARFKTAAGNEHEGIVVFDPDLEEVFAIELFVPGDKITLNVRLPELATKMLERYAIATGYSASDILPIRYRMNASSLNVAPGEFKY